MESQKSEVLKKLQEKGLTILAVSEKIGFNPELLKLYFAQDGYPVPPRIIDKVMDAVNN